MEAASAVERIHFVGLASLLFVISLRKGCLMASFDSNNPQSKSPAYLDLAQVTHILRAVRNLEPA